MSYTNVYPSRINWENEPSIASPINATNLNKIDYAVYEHDQTFETWDVTKANQSDLLLSVKSIDYDTDTGVFVFTWQNGTTKTVDLNIEKIPVSFSMDANGVITMTTDDGTQYTADVGSLIKTYTFNDSTEIDFTVTTDQSGNKTVVASIKDGSIVGTKLEPNYLANCQSAANSASGSATAADGSAEDSEAWAVGTRDGVPVPSTDPAYENNSKYWAEHTSNSLAGLSDTNITSPTDGQALVYNSSSSKWENADQSAGGGSKITVTTTETTLKGKNVTLTQGQTTLTATFDNLGVAVFEGVTLTGTVQLSASDGTSTSTRSLTIPYFGNYEVTMAFFSATITATFPSGATCTCNGVTASTSPYTFNIGSTGTYSVVCTLDGISQTDSVVITTDGQTETCDFEFGTINLTFDNEFRGQTITATDGVSTITKTAPMTGNTMVLYPNATGNWTVSGVYSGTTYVSSPNPVVVSSLSTPVSATLQTLATINVTLHGANTDSITFTDASGVSKTEIFASGETSKSVSMKVIPSGSSITFTSAVSKNPTSLSSDYSKTVTVTSATTDIYVMPDNCLYWYGYGSNNFTFPRVVANTIANILNDAQSGATSQLTNNTNDIQLVANSNSSKAYACCGVICDQQIPSGSTIHIVREKTAGNSTVFFIAARTNQIAEGTEVDSAQGFVQESVISDTSASFPTLGDFYFCVYSSAGYSNQNTGTFKIYGLWYD